MQVSYPDKLKPELNDFRVAQRIYGKQVAKVLHRRAQQLRAARALNDLRGIGGCHELHGNDWGKIAMDLDGGKRIIFIPNMPQEEFLQGSIIRWDLVHSVKIISIEDYH